MNLDYTACCLYFILDISGVWGIWNENQKMRSLCLTQNQEKQPRFSTLNLPAQLSFISSKSYDFIGQTTSLMRLFLFLNNNICDSFLPLCEGENCVHHWKSRSFCHNDYSIYKARKYRYGMILEVIVLLLSQADASEN